MPWFALKKSLDSRSNCLGLRLVREVRDEAAVAIEHIDDRGVIHQVRPAILARDLLVVDAVGARHLRDLVGRAGEADEGRAEVAEPV